MVHPGPRICTPAGEGDLLHTGQMFLSIRQVPTCEAWSAQPRFRRLMRGALDEFVEHVVDRLPAEIRARQELMSLVEALRTIFSHFTRSGEMRVEGSHLTAILSSARLARLRARRRHNPRALAWPSKRLVPQLLQNLPFALTGAQQRGK